MEFTQIDNNLDLVITDEGKTVVIDIEERFGSNEVNSQELLNTGGGCMVDVYHLSNGKSICISDEIVCVYPNPKAYYDSWVTQDKTEEEVGAIFFNWYEE